MDRACATCRYLHIAIERGDRHGRFWLRPSYTCRVIKTAPMRVRPDFYCYLHRLRKNLDWDWAMILLHMNRTELRWMVGVLGFFDDDILREGELKEYNDGDLRSLIKEYADRQRLDALLQEGTVA